MKFFSSTLLWEMLKKSYKRKKRLQNAPQDLQKQEQMFMALLTPGIKSQRVGIPCPESPLTRLMVVRAAAGSDA